MRDRRADEGCVRVLSLDFDGRCIVLLVPEHVCKLCADIVPGGDDRLVGIPEAEEDGGVHEAVCERDAVAEPAAPERVLAHKAQAAAVQHRLPGSLCTLARHKQLWRQVQCREEEEEEEEEEAAVVHACLQQMRRSFSSRAGCVAVDTGDERTARKVEAGPRGCWRRRAAPRQGEVGCAACLGAGIVPRLLCCAACVLTLPCGAQPWRGPAGGRMGRSHGGGWRGCTALQARALPPLHAVLPGPFSAQVFCLLCGSG